jgi:hypothetical protein
VVVPSPGPVGGDGVPVVGCAIAGVVAKDINKLTAVAKMTIDVIVDRIFPNLTITIENEDIVY